GIRDLYVTGVQTCALPILNKKAECHPKWLVNKGTISGAITAPVFEPPFIMPVASARSRRGNQSATVLIAAGKFAASPSPRLRRRSEERRVGKECRCGW